MLIDPVNESSDPVNKNLNGPSARPQKVCITSKRDTCLNMCVFSCVQELSYGIVLF